MKQHMVSIIAIICITLMELVALSQGIDGILLTSSIAIVSALGGYNHGKLYKKKGVKKNGA